MEGVWKIKKKKKLADVYTLCVNVGGCLSGELEDSCWPGSHGSRRCTPGSSSLPSQQDTGLNLAVLGLEEHTEQDQTSNQNQQRHCDKK